MENVIGVLVMLAFAGVSIWQKRQEELKAREEREKRQRQNPEDLPEETRRMLYGESGVPPRPGQKPGHDIPVARRKGEPPMPPRRSPVRPVAQAGTPPIYVEGEVSPWQPHVPTEGPGSAAARQEQAAAEIERQRVEDLRRKLQAQLEARKREAEMAKRRAAQPVPPRPPAQQPQRRPVPAAVASAQPHEGPQAPLPKTAPVPAQAAAARRGSPVTAQALRRILNNPRGIRQAVVLNEILSGPVSMR